MDNIVTNNLFHIPGLPSVLTVNAFNNRSDLGKEPVTHTGCVAKRKRVTSPKEHSPQSQAKTACIPSLLSLPRSEEEATRENTEAEESVGLTAKADVTGFQAEGDATGETTEAEEATKVAAEATEAKTAKWWQEMAREQLSALTDLTLYIPQINLINDPHDIVV